MSALPFQWKKHVVLVLRLFLGGFYLLAGSTKVVNPGHFAEAVANYRLLPHELINLTAITLPWIEIVAGAFLILGIWLAASAWVINAMTLMFIGAITSAVMRGLSIECGCFGTVGGREVGLRAIAEDIGLLVCGLWLVWSTQRAGGNVPGANAPQADLALPTQS
jgi:uncharacterized membrane protein YphA (DoxX/SURF4 family)